MNIGDPVIVRQTGDKGRVCNNKGFGQFCVQFEGICLRFASGDLQPASEPAPVCTPACLSGNC